MIPTLRLKVRSKQEEGHLRHRRLQTENTDLRLHKDPYPKHHPTSKQPLQPTNYLPFKRAPEAKSTKLAPRKEGRSYLQLRT